MSKDGKGTFSESQELNIEEKGQSMKAFNRSRTHRLWVFRIIFLIIVIFIWVLYIGPLLGGIQGILVGTLKVLKPSVDYYNRNNTQHIVYNSMCNITVDSISYQSYNPNSTFNRTCPAAYVFNGTLCTPRCIQWNPGGDVYFWIYRVTTLAGPIIQIGTCGVFIAAWIQAGKSVWRFPSVTSFYLMITILIQSLAVLSGAIVPERFYCTSDELAKSRESSTIPCKVQGAVFHYGIFAFMLWYLSAFVNLTLLVAIPLNVNKILKHKNKIHLLEFAICFLFPIPIVLLSYFGDSDNQGYKINNVPEVCFPQDEFIFATIYLPGILFCVILGSLAMLILYKLFTQQFLSSAGQGLRRTIITDLAFQVILFLVSFGILIWIIMIDYVVYENLKLPYKGFLDEYLRCLTDAFGDESCCRDVYRDYYVSWLSTLSGFFTTVWAAPALLGLAGRIIKQKCCNCVRESESDNRTKFTTTANATDAKTLVKQPTVHPDGETVGYSNPVASGGIRRSSTLTSQSSFTDAPKKSEKFKKANSTVLDLIPAPADEPND